MSLRTRFAAVVAVVVTVTLLLAGLALQAITSAVLLGAVDDDLRAIAASVERDPRGMLAPPGQGRGRFGGAAGLVQVIDDAGVVQRPIGPVVGGDVTIALPVDAAAIEVARGMVPSVFATVRVEGVPLRVLTVPLGGRFALQVARPIDEVETVVAGLRRATLLVGLVGVIIATLVARRVASRAIRPVTELTATVEGVRDGSDLARQTFPERAGAEDEVARLAAAFGAMLARLDAARLAQERLAADAAHELRTPLTSLRTNIEFLAGDVVAEPAGRDVEDRARLAEDLIGQIDELTLMVDGLVALARVDGAASRHGEVELWTLVVDVVDTARRRHPRRAADLVVGARPDPRLRIHGDERELTLAVSALLDNAVKYAPDGAISVGVSGDPREVVVTVRDDGPGVGPDVLPHLFERFFRSPEARSAPGAGLGLALVERVAQAHGGRADAVVVEPSGLAVSIRIPRSDAAVQSS